MLVMLTLLAGQAFGQDADAPSGLPGRVVDAAWEPVPFAKILVWHLSSPAPIWDQLPDPPAATLTADEQGEFLLPASDKWLLVSAEAAGLAAAFDLRVAPGARPRHTLELQLVAEVRWTAHLTTEGGGPIGAGRVCFHPRRDGNAHEFTLDPGVLRVDRPLPDATLRADGSATARVPDVPCFVIVCPEFCADWSGTVNPRTPLALVLPSLHRVAGRLVDSDGAPIADATVNVGSYRQEQTDASGGFSVEVEAQDGIATLPIAAAGFAQTSAVVDVSGGDVSGVVLTLAPVAPLRGVITNAHGDPVNACIDLLRKRSADGSWERVDPQWSFDWWATSSDGSFAAPVPAAGEYMVSIDNANDDTGTQLVLRTGDEPLAIQLGEDEHGALDSLTVLAHEALGGAPIEPTLLQVTTLFGEQRATQSAGPQRAWSMSVSDIPLGRVSLRLAARGHLVHDETIEETEGGGRQVAVSMQPARCVRLRLVDGTGRPLAHARASVLDENGVVVPLLAGPESIVDEVLMDERGEACVDGVPLGPVSVLVTVMPGGDAVARPLEQTAMPGGDSVARTPGAAEGETEEAAAHDDATYDAAWRATRPSGVLPASDVASADDTIVVVISAPGNAQRR